MHAMNREVSALIRVNFCLDLLLAQLTSNDVKSSLFLSFFFFTLCSLTRLLHLVLTLEGSEILHDAFLYVASFSLKRSTCNETVVARGARHLPINIQIDLNICFLLIIEFNRS